MAPYVWWFLIVGLAIGGAVVAGLSMDTARRDEDIDADETEAEAGLIATQLVDEGRPVDRATVLEVLRAHREYRHVPPPDRLVEAGEPARVEAGEEPAAAVEPGSAVDAHPDDEPHEVGDDGGRPTDQHLPPA